METVEIERDYRAACQKMLASLDLRSAMNRVNDEIAKLHQALTVEGSQVLAGPADDEAIHRYRRMVENIVAKLDERDQMRAKDGFKDALQDLLRLGEQLGFARKQAAEPKSEKASEPAAPVPAPAPVARAPITVAPDPAPSLPPLEEPAGFGAVERELAELQSQLAQLQTGGI